MHLKMIVYALQVQNASDDLSPLKYLRDSGIRAVREREVNLSAPIYLLSAVVNRLGERQVNSQVTEVELYYNKHCVIILLLLLFLTLICSCY